MVTFYYRKMRSKVFGEVRRPVADIKLQTSEGKWIRYEPFIDSGADITIIPYSVGKYLGFRMDESKLVHFQGVAGEEIPTILRQVKMMIGGGLAYIEEIIGEMSTISSFIGLGSLIGEINEATGGAP